VTHIGEFGSDPERLDVIQRLYDLYVRSRIAGVSTAVNKPETFTQPNLQQQ